MFSRQFPNQGIYFSSPGNTSFKVKNRQDVWRPRQCNKKDSMGWNSLQRERKKGTQKGGKEKKREEETEEEINLSNTEVTSQTGKNQSDG